MRAPRAVGAGARACAGEGGPQWRGGCASTGVNAHRRAAAAARRRRPARRPRAPAIENRGRPCGPDRRALPQARASSAPSASRPLAARGNRTPPHSRRVHRGRHRPISRPPRTSARTPRRARRSLPGVGQWRLRVVAGDRRARRAVARRDEAGRGLRCAGGGCGGCGGFGGREGRVGVDGHDVVGRRDGDRDNREREQKRGGTFTLRCSTEAPKGPKKPEKPCLAGLGLWITQGWQSTFNLTQTSPKFRADFGINSSIPRPNPVRRSFKAPR